MQASALQRALALIRIRQTDIIILRIEVYKASKNDVEAVRKLIENISGKHAYHNDIMNIIDEEAESYFCGQKSIEQAAKIIQNRVQLYLDENK